MRPKSLSLVRALFGVASLAAAACGGVSNQLVVSRDGGLDESPPDEGGTDPAEGGGTTTCGAAVACGSSGATYQECTQVGAAGACSAIVYEVSSGKSFTCEGCSGCESTQQALSAYCASSPATEAGAGEGGPSDASTDGGGDAGLDASDAGPHPDSSAPDASAEAGHDGSTDAVAEAGPPDASIPDSSADGGGEEGGCTPGTTQCAGSEVQLCGTDGQWGAPESDPIWAVEASARSPDGGIDVMNFDGDNGGPSPTSTGVAPDGRTVTFDVWTAPGVSTLSVMYWLDGDYMDISAVPLSISGTTGEGLEKWSGTLAAQTSGTTVTWWAQGTDVCHTGTDYYSNAGNNYVYTTP